MKGQKRKVSDDSESDSKMAAISERDRDCDETTLMLNSSSNYSTTLPPSCVTQASQDSIHPVVPRFEGQGTGCQAAAGEAEEDLDIKRPSGASERSSLIIPRQNMRPQWRPPSQEIAL